MPDQAIKANENAFGRLMAAEMQLRWLAEAVAMLDERAAACLRAHLADLTFSAGGGATLDTARHSMHAFRAAIDAGAARDRRDRDAATPAPP